MSDVAAQLHAIELDARCEGIGALLRELYIVAERSDT